MRPHVVLHTAVSADGRTDWFSADVGLFYSIAARWHEDATLAGSETLLRAHPGADDDPVEDVEKEPPLGPADRRPLLVVVDSQGRFRRWSVLRAAGFWRGFIALCSRQTPADHLAYLERRGITCHVLGDRHVDLGAALELLADQHLVKTVRVDSGGTLQGLLLRAGLADEVSLLIHPVLVGGQSAQSGFRAPDLISPSGLIRLQLKSVQWLSGETIWLLYDVQRA